MYPDNTMYIVHCTETLGRAFNAKKILALLHNITLFPVKVSPYDIKAHLELYSVPELPINKQNIDNLQVL